MPSLRKGDIGTAIRWTFFEDGPVDVSLATIKQVKIIKPDGSHAVWNLVFSTKPTDSGDGTDGRVEYKTVLGDLIPGTYQWQLYTNIPAWSGHSQGEGTFVVEDTLF